MAILYAALASPHGLIVRGTAGETFVALSRRAYAARAAARDPRLAELSFRRSPNDPEGELWIIRKSNASPSESTT